MTLPGDLPSGHPAAEILARYDGLKVGECITGHDCATSDVFFRARPADDDDEEIAGWQHLLNTRLVSIADVHHGHGELFVCSSGRLFLRSYVHDAFGFQGESFASGMENLLLGMQTRPMLRPGQQSVTMYGVKYTQESPELYKY